MKFDEGRNNIGGDLLWESVKKICCRKPFPSSSSSTQDTARKFPSEIKSLLLFRVSAKADEYAAQVEVAKDAAKENKGRQSSCSHHI